MVYTGNIMVKQKKKRTKKYAGADTAITRTNITRVQAANRGRFGQWFYERKKVLKTIGGILLVVFAIILIVSGIISLF